MERVLVYGFYGKGNLGDELFKDAFRHLWPEIDFKFVNRLTQKDIDKTTALVFGGGSFLYAPPNMDAGISISAPVKVMYVGVGGETVLDNFHRRLMRGADLVSLRTPDYVDSIVSATEIHPSKVMHTPDIVLSLKRSMNIQRQKRTEKSLLVLANAECIPRASDPHWKHLGWEHFKNEFAQALDQLHVEGYRITFASMCENNVMSDTWAGTEIVARMDKRKRSFCPGLIVDPMLTRPVIEEFSCVVTQRLHGAVIAELANLPHVVVHHHDKLRTLHPCSGVKLSFFEMSKQSIVDAIRLAEYQSYSLSEDVIDASFVSLQEKVRTIIAT